MTFRYIGSKTRVVDQITSFLGPSNGGWFVDAFCGTGVVAEAAASLGWKIRINDHLQSAVISASARLTSTYEAPFSNHGGYERAIDSLNNLPPTQGYIWRTYSPASFDFYGIERKYFTQENAAKIDAVRQQISVWRKDDLISDVEERLLIADLFSALNRVANIAGTFGCFLSKWTKPAGDTLQLRTRGLKSLETCVETSVGDVFDVPNESGDTVYLDPPYTKRQYASYYHILETVALHDEPLVEGVAGLRPWKHLASDFCYKVRALDTLKRLIQSLRSERVLLSYSNQGHIAISDLEGALWNTGRMSVHPLGTIGRYRPNVVASNNSDEVTEYLILVDRTRNSTYETPEQIELALER